MCRNAGALQMWHTELAPCWAGCMLLKQCISLSENFDITSHIPWVPWPLQACDAEHSTSVLSYS
jgi:hypothetical protein